VEFVKRRLSAAWKPAPGGSEEPCDYTRYLSGAEKLA
jgi:hypothetical protein